MERRIDCFTSGSDPYDSDSDDDLFPDGFEKSHGCNHRSSSSRPDTVKPSVTVDGIKLRVDTVKGLRFQLERSNDNSTWEPIGEPFSGSGASVDVLLNGSDGLAFVRVKVVAE